VPYIECISLEFVSCRSLDLFTLRKNISNIIVNFLAKSSLIYMITLYRSMAFFCLLFLGIQILFIDNDFFPSRQDHFSIFNLLHMKNVAYKTKLTIIDNFPLMNV
jgi:hypothetical protein